MFGSLILPTTTTTGGAAAAVTTRTRSRSGGGGGIQRDHLSFIPNNTMSNFPSRNKLHRTRWRRIRASFTTTTAAEAASDTTTTTLDLYQILRIKQNASSLEIKTAYRKLAKQFHPDALPPPPPPPTTSSSESSSDGARDFMAIHNAYATLSDPTERARYDLSIQIIHNTRSRFHRSYYSSSSTAPVDDDDGNEDRWRKSYYGIMQTTTRRWETDQCW